MLQATYEIVERAAIIVACFLFVGVIYVIGRDYLFGEDDE